MAFELINWSSSSNPLVSFVKGVGDTVSNGSVSSIGNPIGLLIVLATVLVTLFGTGFNSLGNSLVAASFVGGIIAFFLVAMGLLNSFFIYLFIITLVAGVFFMIFEKR